MIPPVAEQGEVVADGGLALAQLFAQRTDVPFAFGQHQDHLEAGRVTDLLPEQVRGRCAPA